MLYVRDLMSIYPKIEKRTKISLSNPLRPDDGMKSSLLFVDLPQRTTACLQTPRKKTHSTFVSLENVKSSRRKPASLSAVLSLLFLKSYQQCHHQRE